ncbi:lytic transglycosylase domain-containing protein [Mycolicibacterium pyrenivorans]|uniref:lytic transglycosylase domain-containing protein n=1 Tax=Mycolicibacterium pyrenivorans TaxID=187102 RepID=UPI0021F34E1C|nr:lytic transglycosylase domain-containing protein [Mycolicibacterium pyrenivorans]MCV7150025.1 lytic murein transglycosylase [Mycolicibacterium pyrenivorans]
MTRVRWLQAIAVIGATALLLAASCSWQLGTPIPEGVPPPAGAAVPQIDTYARGRPADQLREWAAERAPALGIPATALEAYAYAARVAEVENPDCHLAWTTLAGIGQVESHHGTYRGATIAPNGDISPPIRGVLLDGTNGNLEIMDHDSVSHDPAVENKGDEPFARAMGPMQFIPETWRLYGVDANNDRAVDVDNIDDAALSAAGYLCWRGKDLATPRGWMEALRAYNHSEQYARTVRDWATAYADGHAL